MVNLLSQSALVAAVLLYGVNAVMIPNDAFATTVKDLLGFDPNLIKDFSIQDVQDYTLPEIIYLDDDEVSLLSNGTAMTQIEPSVPSDDALEQLHKRFIDVQKSRRGHSRAKRLVNDEEGEEKAGFGASKTAKSQDI